MDQLRVEIRTIVLYEAPHRLLKTLREIHQVLGDRPVAVARELTKKFEEVQRGLLSDVLRLVEKREPRGEYVIVIAGAEKPRTHNVEPENDHGEETGDEAPTS